MKKNFITFLSVILLTTLVLSGCTKQSTVNTPIITAEAPVATEATTATIVAETAAVEVTKQPEPTTQVFDPSSIVIGYENSSNNMSEDDEQALLKACTELGIQCIEGNNIGELTEKNVNAIISASNPWHVLGSFPAIMDAVGKGILEVNVNGETEMSGAFNVSTESEKIEIELKSMFDNMGGSGEFAYYMFYQPDSTTHHMIEKVIQDYPEIKAFPVPSTFENNTLTEQGVTDLIVQNPELGAIWADNFFNNLFWGTKPKDEKSGKYPMIVCNSNKESLEWWKDRVTNNPTFNCITTVIHTGQYYESVYVAYYILSGLKVNPSAMGGVTGNTFKYDLQTITNENLDEWFEKLDTMELGKGGLIFTPALTPEEIKAKWFVE